MSVLVRSDKIIVVECSTCTFRDEAVLPHHWKCQMCGAPFRDRPKSKRRRKSKERQRTDNSSSGGQLPKHLKLCSSSTGTSFASGRSDQKLQSCKAEKAPELPTGIPFILPELPDIVDASLPLVGWRFQHKTREETIECLRGSLSAVREPQNPVDSHAIRVDSDGYPLGHLPRVLVAQISPALDAKLATLELETVITESSESVESGEPIMLTARLRRTDTELASTRERMQWYLSVRVMQRFELRRPNCAEDARELSQEEKSNANELEPNEKLDGVANETDAFAKSKNAQVRAVRYVIDVCLKRQRFLRLLDEHEKQILRKLQNLSSDAMTILCKMYWRKATWFKLERDLLRRYHDQVECVHSALDELKTAELCVSLCRQVDLDSWKRSSSDALVDAEAMRLSLCAFFEAAPWDAAQLLTSEELRSFEKHLNMTPKTSGGNTKRDRIAAVYKEANLQKDVFGRPIATRAKQQLACTLGECLAISAEVARTLTVAQRLVFLVRGVDFASGMAMPIPVSTPYLLEDIGAVRYERYRLWDDVDDDEESFVFKTRAQLTEFMYADFFLEMLEAFDTEALPRAVKCPEDIVYTRLRKIGLSRTHEFGEAQGELSLFEEVAIILAEQVAANLRASLLREAAKEHRSLMYRQFTPEWVLTHAMWRSVVLLEQLRPFGDDKSRSMVSSILRDLLSRPHLCPSLRGKWWDRLTLDLVHVGLLKEAYDALTEALTDGELRGGWRIAIERRRFQVHRKLEKQNVRLLYDAEPAYKPREAIVLEARPLKGVANAEKVGSAVRFVDYEDEIVNVEKFVLQHFARQGWRGAHSESLMWSHLFTLLLWDVIFDDTVPFVFQTPFQRAPLDYRTDAFASTRQSQLEQRFQEIEGEFVPFSSSDRERRRDWPIANQVLDAWAKHCGVAALGVQWRSSDARAYGAVDLAELATYVGPKGLGLILRALATDLSSSGMPDLVLWRERAEVPRGGEAFIIEVKSKNDQLSDRQKAWLRLMHDEAGLNARVLRLRDPEV